MNLNLLLQSELPTGYGGALLQTLLALGGVCLLAWVVLKWGVRRGVGRGKRVQILERVHLDSRRAIVLLKVDEQELLLGVGDGGPPNLLHKLNARSFRQALDEAKGDTKAEDEAAVDEASEADAVDRTDTFTP